MKHFNTLGCASFIAVQAALGTLAPAFADSPTVVTSVSSTTTAAAKMPAVATTPPAPAAPPAAVNATPCSPTVSASAAMEARFLTLINTERTAHGEAALTLDPLLQTTARAHSREMCDKSYFGHISPSLGLTTPLDRYGRTLHDVCATLPSAYLLGENIFYCSVYDSRHNADYGHASLMHSAPHRQNILDAHFTKVGIGVYMDAGGAFWVTQMFLRDQP